MTMESHNTSCTQQRRVNHFVSSDVFQSFQNYSKCHWTFRPQQHSSVFWFPQVHATEKEGGDGVVDTTNSDEKSLELKKHLAELENLAKLYISKESGWDRVQMIFKTDHRGKNSEELNLITVSLVQIFVITFFCKYFPVAKFARQEFIHQHRGTVFRTRLEAIRLMNDQMFMKAATEGGVFSTKITLFSAGFLFISQVIASYRNKTSVVEYTVAAALTGGISRLTLGIKGFISGTVIGAVLGSFIGLVGYSALTAYNVAQEDRHLSSIMSKLEVERSVVGDESFHKTMSDLRKTS